MATAAVHQAYNIQSHNLLPKEPSSTCDCILKVSGIALAVFACLVLFIFSPLSAAVTTAVWLSNYARDRGEDTFTRNFLNGAFVGAVYHGFSHINALVLPLILC
jgi:succinate dehydrogenase/fumarate reductase cytochrome b subunit